MKRPIIAVLALAVLVTACTRDDFFFLAGEPHATSLFVATDRHEKGEGNNLAAMLRLAVEGSEVTPSMVVLGGDYVGSMANATPPFSIADLYNEIDSTLAPPMRDVVITYGSHDNGCREGYAAFFSGPRRADGYYVYGISYAQMIYATDTAVRNAVALYHREQERQADTAGGQADTTGGGYPPRNLGYDGMDTADRYGLSAESASRNFTRWVHSLGDHAPIVVMSHVPLHANRHDNLGALAWYEAFTDAACSHDVIFLWGHNHTLEEMRDNPPVTLSDSTQAGDSIPPMPPIDFADEQPFYLLVPGEHIALQTTVDSVSVTMPLNFTYCNGGYLKLGHATVITFSTDGRTRGYDKIHIQRFSLAPAAPEPTFGTTTNSNPYTATLRFR